MIINLEGSVEFNRTEITNMLVPLNFLKIEDDFIFDFKKVRWFDSHLTTLLGVLVDRLHSNSKKVFFEFGEEESSTKKILSQNGFLKHYNINPINKDIHNTSIPFKVFKSKEYDAIDSYLNNDVFTLIENKIHSDDLGIIEDSIYELCLNVHEHSNSEKFFLCGQYFPRKHKVILCFADAGVSIPHKISQKLHLKDDLEYIDWATNQGHSTKTSAYSGLGLTTIRNNMLGLGDVEIVSRAGYWSVDSQGLVGKQHMYNEFPGTMINLTFYLTGHPLRSNRFD
ncbi:hypothetical protein ACTQ45_13270 [Fundicoccus sp. Sow4_D5]|uniref:hypothetical protein n=1 Tax=Fundicoccus sp. Sow4_D5 TaxID=3438782 RepID=UPI003F8DB6D5